MKFIDEKIKDTKKDKISELITSFISEFNPLEKEINVMTDFRTKSYYIEVHIKAKDLLEKSTIDAPIDPDEQVEYRANRELVEDSSAFLKMKEDAKYGRTFSNIIAEYNLEFAEDKPLKIIGGQHRYTAIEEAYNQKQVNHYHELKVFFDLNNEQRLDIQLISNTNISVSPDLLDRMFETMNGPKLRTWCQKVGFLEKDQDFADKKQRSNQITVRMARSFILSYFEGNKHKKDTFEVIEPLPIIASTGGLDENWEILRRDESIWDNEKLDNAAKQYILMHQTQVDYFKNKAKAKIDFAFKALNYSIISSWAYIAGFLEDNKVRLARHYNLGKPASVDPLNASVLAKARHKSDLATYRGLGTRTDKKERGRLAELFFLQAENGKGITKPLVDVAVQQYHVKLANIELKEAKSKLK
jgi:hypothetical protein